MKETFTFIAEHIARLLDDIHVSSHFSEIGAYVSRNKYCNLLSSEQVVFPSQTVSKYMVCSVF